MGVETRWVGGEASDQTDRLVPGLLVMFLMFAVTLGAQALVEERQNGTLERLMTTRLGVNQLFIGKFLASVLRAIVQALILLSLAFTVLGIGDAIDFVELMIFSVLVAIAVSAIGLVIGSAARTRDQATWAAVFFTMFMTVFGGTFFDVAGGGALDVALANHADALRHRRDVRDAGKRRFSGAARTGRGCSGRSRGLRPADRPDDVQGCWRRTVAWA